MPIASATTFIQGLLDGMAWPAGMQALPSPPPNLIAYILPPDPNVLAGTPTCYVWFERGEESRTPSKYGAGTVPRAAYPGAPSGTKTEAHQVLVYLVWTGVVASDPNAAMLFPGMIDAIMATLRTSTNPAVVADPWTGVQTQLVDIGEQISYVTYLRALEPQQSERLDALLTVPITEIISS